MSMKEKQKKNINHFFEIQMFVMSSVEILENINQNYQWLPQVADSTNLAMKRFADKNFIAETEVWIHRNKYPFIGPSNPLELLQIHDSSGQELKDTWVYLQSSTAATFCSSSGNFRIKNFLRSLDYGELICFSRHRTHHSVISLDLTTFRSARITFIFGTAMVLHSTIILVDVLQKETSYRNTLEMM